MSRTRTVLVIDDDAMIRSLVVARLKPLDVHVVCAEHGEAGLAAARHDPPDLILLDVSMPGLGGFDVCRRLRSDPLTTDIPVIFLTGSERSDEKVRGFELGAVDYVTKPFDAAELCARVRAALRDQALVEALEVQARTDDLTGLPNRQGFHNAIMRCLERAREGGDAYRFAILFLDLDRFKVINDSLGHSVGDELIIAVANTLHTIVCGGDGDDGDGDGDAVYGSSRHVVARMGGDEFAILLDDLDDFEVARTIADRIRTKLSQPFMLNGYQVASAGSIGMRLGRGDCGTAESLLRDSDTAMYAAKHSGRGRIAVFDESMHQEAISRLTLEHELRQAVEEGQFRLYYQPVVSLNTGQRISVEALLRWEHPVRGLTYPESFISVAEETGLIMPIGRWVLREACRQLRAWREQHPHLESLRMSVNMSKVQISATGFVDEVLAMLRDADLEPETLELELTESAIMHNSRMLVPTLETLREAGVRLAMDDFGTGYSSLSLLHRLPLDTLKIDKTFIDRMSDSRPYAAIVQAIVTLAQNLGLEVVAEGVETERHVSLLQALECDHAQGFHFGRPAPAPVVLPSIDSPAGLAQSA